MKGLKKGCLAAAAAALLLAGSGAAVRAEEPLREAETEEQSGSLSDESLAEQGESLAVSMAEGSFEEAEALFSQEMKAQLPAGTMKAVWEQTVAGLGAYVDVYEVQESGGPAGDIVKVTLRYEQSGLNVLFTFTGGEISGLWLNYYNIPQEASSGEGYQEQEISIGEYELDGRLTLPEDAQNPPVVILIQGSGQSDMNETVGEAGNAPFRDLALGLAERGIATIRYNKRYYQYPEAAPADLTIQDEVLEDAAAAIAWAAECGLVDENRIIVLGHSLGGMLAPAIAAENPRVSAMISLAGSPRKLEDIMIDQNRDALENAGLSAEEVEEQMELVEAEAGRAREAEEGGTDIVLGAPESYWYSLNQIDGAQLALDLAVPMLFLQGEADFQVYADTDFAMWQELLEEKEQVSFRLYEGLNHMFMPSSGKRDVTEYDAPAHVEEQVLQDIADWIDSLQASGKENVNNR